MTSRERLLTVLRGEIPDCVPVAPDFSNMIPAKLTGKPWWDIYLYNDPPIFEAYVECAKKFDIDSLMDGYFPFQYPWQVEEEERFEQENPPSSRKLRNSSPPGGALLRANGSKPSTSTG